MACILVVLIVLSLAGCKKTEQIPNDDQTTTTTTTTTETTTDEDLGPTLSHEEAKATIVGTWVYDEKISPQKFYGDYYNEKITKTDVQMRTTYKFNQDGTYSATVTISNISDVRKEYRSLMVEGARINSESNGKLLTTAEVKYYESYADGILKDICKEKKSTYEIDGNKIKYGDSTTETFGFKNKQLILKGSTQTGDSYKITLKKK